LSSGLVFCPIMKPSELTSQHGTVYMNPHLSGMPPPRTPPVRRLVSIEKPPDPSEGHPVNSTTRGAMHRDDWWRTAVIYQVYPRSFADANGDGVGDLPGITHRLPALAELGVDAVWLSPFFTSPQADAGYDV